MAAKERRNQELAEMMAAIEVEESKLRSRKKALIGDILDRVDDPPDTGTVTIPGETHQIKVVFKQNTSFPDKDKLNDLVEALGPSADGLFRFELKPRGAAVDKFIDSGESEHAAALAELRVKRPASPSVKVEVKK